MPAAAPTLKRILNDYSLDVFNNELVGEWDDPGYAAALLHSLEGVDLNEHKAEIVAVYVRRDVSDRAKRQVFVTDAAGVWQPSMFSEEIARQGVIRLGNGNRVKMYEATGLHWQSHLFQQQKALTATAQSVTRTVLWLESTVGTVLMNHPHAKTHEVMKDFGLWTSK
jgi:hypothetical protein